MKSIAKVILVGGFIVAAQAAQAAGSTFPAGDMDLGLDVTPQTTYMELHANDPVKRAGPAPSDDMEGVPTLAVQSTHADRRANAPVKSTGSAFPSNSNND